MFEDRNGDVIYYVYNGSEGLGFIYYYVVKFNFNIPLSAGSFSFVSIDDDSLFIGVDFT